MKYINKLFELGCFSRRDVVSLTGNEQAAHSLLHDYLKAGYIERIRRDLYTAISFEAKQPVANRFMIATHIAEDACVSFHSAFEYYGYANQVFYEVYVTTTHRFSDFNYDGIAYTRVSPRIETGTVINNAGIRITDPERTVVDSIYAFEKVGGLEELLRCLDLIPSLRSEKITLYLDEYGLAHLYQRTGFILMHFSEQLGLEKSFFDYCQSRIPTTKKYLYSEKDSFSRDFILHKEWRLFAPGNILAIVNKGGD
ncbi:MAG: transcriptional regulator [Clostridiaceae bacterium]|nr:transcriptional regulator [Clostridiaceae bacterium]